MGGRLKAAALVAVGLLLGGVVSAGAVLPVFDSGAPTTLCYDNKGVVTRPANGNCPTRKTSFSVANPAQVDALDAAIGRVDAEQLAAERLDPQITVSFSGDGTTWLVGYGLYPGHYYYWGECGAHADSNGRLSVAFGCSYPTLTDYAYKIYDASSHDTSSGPIVPYYNDYGQVVDYKVYCVDPEPRPNWATAYGFPEPCAPHHANLMATN
ncbi:MAG: hypothetical protein Q8K58_13740 [Acidimicrobiales bacterium]|nr:hypothetical protein [Acidimicrobiales bacterium]